MTLREPERAVLALLARGYSPAEAGAALKMTKTVLSGHLRNVRRRMDVPTTTAAVVRFLRELPPDQRGPMVPRRPRRA